MRTLLPMVLVVSIALAISVPATAQSYLEASLTGAQVVNPTTSPATGLGCFVLNANNTLDFQISYSGLQGAETGAHIHGPAPAGVNAGVQFPLPAGNPKIGQVGPLTAVQVADLLAGRYYVQIHSTLFLGGEIRGQILIAATQCAVATDETSWGVVKSLYR